MEIGCSVSLQDMALAHDAGFDFVELQAGSVLPEMDDSHFDAVRETVLRSPIAVKSFNAFLPQHMKIVGRHMDQHQYKTYVITTLRRIRDLGGERVSFGSGHARSCPEDFSKEQAEEQIVEFLEFTADAAGEMGIQVNVEALNRTECNMIRSLPDANRYVERLHRSNVSLLADFYHMQLEQEPLEHLKQVRNNLNYVHVADTGRFYPGSGEFPFQALMQMLRQIGYNGPVSVECTWRDVKTEIPKAGQFMKSITRQG